MATEISVRISRNPYGFPGARFEASFVWNGLLNRYQFDDRFQLADKLVDDTTEQVVIDEVMDSLDATEWGEKPVYPLGVVYVGEAVCDMAAEEADCERDQKDSTQQLNKQMSDLRSIVRSQWWFTGAALVLIGIVAWFV